MSEIFFCSDTHFDDENQLKYTWTRRIFKNIDELNEKIISNWNSVVGPLDTVYHLGDFCHKNATEEDVVKFRWKLNGQIILIKGNHDILSNEVYVKNFTNFITGPKTLSLPNAEKAWLCHYPIQRNLSYYTLTGHIHEKWRVQKRMLNVGMDVSNFIPLNMEDIMFVINAEKDGHWDANVYPDAPLSWRIHCSRNARDGNEPTKDILIREMNYDTIK